MKITEDKETLVCGVMLDNPTFSDLVYSPEQKEFMLLALKQLNKGSINLLFSGFAGCGKTYSAKMLACESKKPFIAITGSMGKGKIIEMLRGAKQNSIILIDEIHNLSERVSEIIYPAIEYSELYIDGEVIELNNLSFIGTTTEPEKLPKPLLDRFFRIEFKEPERNILIQILDKQKINSDVVNILLNYTLNIRVINKLLKTAKLYGSVTKENILKVFDVMKINTKTGLSIEQEQYLAYLKSNGKSSLRNISLFMRRSESYIKEDIEAELIRKDMIYTTSRGREVKE